MNNQDDFDDKSQYFFDKFIKQGMTLSTACITSLINQFESTIKKYKDFYPQYYDHETLQRLLIREPKKYRKGVLKIESSHAAFCKLENELDGIKEIAISGRSKCGRAFTDDEVVVEILSQETPLKKKRTETTTYGRVIGIIKKKRKNSLKNHVYVCELDKFDNNQAIPICKTIPKIQLVKEKTDEGVFTVDIFKYCPDTRDLVYKESVRITPKHRQKYLFYVVYLGWTCIYPVGVVIYLHKPNKNLESSDLKILELQYEVPTLYNPKTVLHTRNTLELKYDEMKENRADLTDVQVFTVDPIMSDVIDDAISLDNNPNKKYPPYRVGIHIADITTLIDQNGPIDKEARERGTIFYEGKFNKAHYMLPEPLSTDTCSLLPGKTRFAITVFLYFSKDFEFQVHRFLRSVIKSRERMNYQQVQRIIEGTFKSEFKDDIDNLLHIAKCLRQKRLGKAMYAVPFEFDELNEIENESCCSEAYYLIGEFMILTNEIVAQQLVNSKELTKCVPLRSHDEPPSKLVEEWLKTYPQIVDQIIELQGKKASDHREIDLDLLVSKKKQMRYNKVCQLQKWVWKHISDSITKNDLGTACKLILTDNLHPFQALAIDEWISFQTTAEYRCSGDVTKKGGSHFGLNKHRYVHFTSPLRRYIDIVVHRLLIASLENESSPYTQNEIRDLCIEMNEKTGRSKQFKTKCKTVSLAHRLLKQPEVVHCFVKSTTDEKITLVIPGLRFLNDEIKSLLLGDLDVCCQPTFKTDKTTGADILELNWEKRIYSRLKYRPKPMYPAKGYRFPDNGEPIRINPMQRTEVQSLKLWIELLEYSCSNKIENLKQKQGDKSDKAHYLPVTFMTENDVNCELEQSKEEDSTVKHNKIITNQSCKFSMTFNQGQILALQLSARMQKGILTPYLQMLDLTKNVKFCIEHTRDPVLCLEKYTAVKTKPTYKTVDDYVRIWMPIVKMESVSNAVKSDTITINEINLVLKGKKGHFYLDNDFCDERDINLEAFEIRFLDFDVESLPKEDRSRYYAQKMQYLCIRCTMVKADNIGSGQERGSCNSRSLPETLHCPEDYFIWSTHATVSNVWKSKEKGTTRVDFDIHEQTTNTCLELQDQNKRHNFSVEIMSKTAIDQRIEACLQFLPEATALSKAIALKLDIPDFDTEHGHLSAITRTDVPDLGLPQNNGQQNSAISLALRKKVSFIHGPPGTGKTNTAVKLIYLFNNINRKLEKEGKGKKRILFCGPSNKSVDVVAVRLLENKTKSSPSIARLYGASLANYDYSCPGKFFKPNRKSNDEKPDERLKSITIHQLIRQDGKPHAAELKEFGKLLKDKNNIQLKSIQDYQELVSKATQEELTNYDVIFCTTSVATNSKIFQLLKNQIFQVIIDECGMCTEPECLATIVSTRAEQVVLIGDHKQLRPVIMCDQADRLGLGKSLFERYYEAKNSKKYSVQLTTQYRMHPSICELPSALFYDSSLITGVSSAYEEVKHLHIWDNFNGRRHVFCHVEGNEEALTVSSGEGNEMSRSNKQELEQVMKILKYLQNKEGLFKDKSCSLNIMSQYRAQCSAITKEIEKCEKDKNRFHGVEVNTVNGSQGGEWDYVIFSLVRSLPEIRIEKYPTKGWSKKNLGFITDENQTNVALTRARKGLFIIGNKNLLRCNRMWKKLLEEYEKYGCVVDAERFPPPYKKTKDKMRR